MLRAINVAKYFIKEGYDTPSNTFEGNMKLQKLLYFSQLIHLAKYGETLFDESICAFRKGSVVEDVRLEYKNNHKDLTHQATMMECDFGDEEIDTIETTISIFGSLSAEELSEINHLHYGWNKAYSKSKINGYHYKEESKILIEDIIEHDLDDIYKVLEAYEKTSTIDQKYEIVNNVKYYYNPEELVMNDRILDYLKTFPADESAYTVCVDEGLGVVVY